MKAVTVPVCFPCTGIADPVLLTFQIVFSTERSRCSYSYANTKELEQKASIWAVAPGACSAANLQTPEILWNGKTDYEGRFAADGWG